MRALYGLFFGALAAFLFDPISGGRRRALLRDKAMKARNDVTNFSDKFMRDKANRFEGIKHETRKLVDKGKVMLDKKRAEMSGGDMGGIAPTM